MAHLPPLSQIPSACFTGEFALLIISLLVFYVAKFESLNVFILILE
jgi:hypothetical protein